MARSKTSTTPAAADQPQIDWDWRDISLAAEAIQHWRTLLMAGRLPPVLMLTGRAGIGKKALLAALAALHWCEQGTACGLCASCAAVRQGRHPELIWLSGADQRLGVAEAEALQAHLNLYPVPPARWRIAVIADADHMGAAAANRLLKTLEEPPPAARILLSSSRPGLLLDTVRSRCVRWALQAPRVEGTRDVDDLSVPDLQPLWQASTPAQALAAAEDLARQGGWPLAKILEQAEQSLNQWYRQCVAAQSPPPLVALRRRREVLGACKRLACRAGVALNAQLTLEAMALAGVKE